MDGQKRKREENGETNGKRGNKAKSKAEQETVTEDEVEEFFAILRRMHEAVKYFENGNNKDGVGRRKLTDARWRPCFQAEDFNDEQHNGVNNDSMLDKNGGRQKEESGEEESDSGLGLDLNSDPPSSQK